MKHFVVLLLLTSFFSCKSKVPVFEMYQEVNFIIPSGKDPIATHHFLIHKIPSFLQSHLDQKGLKLSDVKELSAGRGKIESAGNNNNFGIINKISISIYKKGDYANRYEIYYHDEIPLTRKGELKLLSTGQDVREIISLKEYEMDVEVQFKGFTSETIECRMTFNYGAYLE